MNQKSIKIRLFVLCQSTTPSREVCPEAWSPIRLHWRKLILPLPVVINFNFLLDQGRDTMSTSPFQCGTPSGFKLCRSCLNFHSISEIICICAIDPGRHFSWRHPSNLGSFLLFPLCYKLIVKHTCIVFYVKSGITGRTPQERQESELQ